MPEKIAKRVMLIGWDAADWDIIRPLIERGAMPNFKRFLDDGAWGNIATLNPVLSPILWNSIATGKHAHKHDILGFMEPDGQGFVRPVSSTSRKAKAIWNILSQSGMRSAVVGWFASYPAERINGAIVTDRYEGFVDAPDKFADDANAYLPESLKDDLRAMHLCKDDIVLDQARVFIPEIESIDTSTDPLPGVFAHMLAQCASVHNAATYLLENEDWDFAALYYTAIDHFGHAFQEFHPPKMDHVSDEQFRLYRNVITSVYQYHDMMLGRLLELAGDETTVILMSDHGFKSGVDRPKIFVDPKTGERSGPGMAPVPWHRQFGVLAAMGPGIAKGREVRGASLLDVCPTILTLLGLPVGADMDGKVIEPLFAEPPRVETIASHEPQHEGDGVHRGEHIEDPYAAQEVLKQLAELGYVEAPGEDKEMTVKRTIRDRQDALATVHFSSGRVDEAVTILRGLVDDFDEPYYRYRLGNALAKMGRLDEVEALIERSEKDDHGPMVSILKGQVRLSQGRMDEAIEIFESVLERSPGMHRVRNLLARPLIAHERWADAERVLRKALEINPEDPEALDLLGVVLRRLGRAEDAVHALMKSVTLLHQQPVAHFHLGEALCDTEQWDWAIRAFEVALEQGPRNPLVHQHLARIYKKIKKDDARAAEHAKAATLTKAEHDKAILERQLGVDWW